MMAKKRISLEGEFRGFWQDLQDRLSSRKVGIGQWHQHLEQGIETGASFLLSRNLETRLYWLRQLQYAHKTASGPKQNLILSIVNRAYIRFGLAQIDAQLGRKDVITYICNLQTLRRQLLVWGKAGPNQYCVLLRPVDATRYKHEIVYHHTPVVVRVDNGSIRIIVLDSVNKSGEVLAWLKKSDLNNHYELFLMESQLLRQYSEHGCTEDAIRMLGKFAAWPQLGEEIVQKGRLPLAILLGHVEHYRSLREQLERVPPEEFEQPMPGTHWTAHQFIHGYGIPRQKSDAWAAKVDHAIRIGKWSQETDFNTVNFNRQHCACIRNFLHAIFKLTVSEFRREASDLEEGLTVTVPHF